MKKIYKTTIIIIICFSFLSCEKNEDEDNNIVVNNEKNAEFTCNGEKYFLTKGMFHDDTYSGNDFSTYQFIFSNDSVFYNSNNQNFSGKGELILISLNTNKKNDTITGKYYFCKENIPQVFQYGVACIKYDFENNSGIMKEPVDGEITIKYFYNDLINLEFIFNFKDSTELIGHYNGSIDTIQ